MSPPSPTLATVDVAGDPSAWRMAGFDVSASAVAVGGVVVWLSGSSSGRLITGWALHDLETTELDGLPTAVAPGPLLAASGAAERPAHPNGVTAIDHVVAFSPDLERTIGALKAAGLDFRRLREEPTPAGAQRQAFFRVGEAILEVIEHPPGSPGAEDPGAPSRFYGLAFRVEDLDATARMLGDLLREPRDAVQPGRRIATVRREADLGLPVAFMAP